MSQLSNPIMPCAVPRSIASAIDAATASAE
jgi:hypothetical protein